MSESALIPDKNILSPAPDQFTHTLTRAQPYYFGDARRGAKPAGQFEAGTQVVLLVHDGDDEYCRVADGRGLYVQTEYSGLKKL